MFDGFADATAAAMDDEAMREVDSRRVASNLVAMRRATEREEWMTCRRERDTRGRHGAEHAWFARGRLAGAARARNALRHPTCVSALTCASFLPSLSSRLSTMLL